MSVPTKSQRFPDLRGRQRVSAEGGGRNAVLSRDGRELYYRRPSDGAMMVVSLQTKPSLSIGTPKVLFRDQGYSRIVHSRSWDLSPDGRFLMIKEGSSPAVSESRPIVLVQNWFNELRRAVSAD